MLGYKKKTELSITRQNQEEADRKKALRYEKSYKYIDTSKLIIYRSVLKANLSHIYTQI